MTGLQWKRNADEILARRRRFFRREMPDGILVTFLSLDLDLGREWQAFDRKWGQWPAGAKRPFPSPEEIFERESIRLEKRGLVEDDWLPVSYSTLDLGESMVAAMFGADLEFIHRPHEPAVSIPRHLLPDYDGLSRLAFSLDGAWPRRFLSIQQYFNEHCQGRFAQHPFLVMDGLNFACELRGATQVYLDIYEHPDQLRQLLEIGLDFNIRLQEAQLELIGGLAGGGFNWLAGWLPFNRSVSLSVDAYVICSTAHYAEFGFDYQRRLVERFGHGTMHFHCNRTDLAAEVARLPGLELFQFGGDTRDPVPEIDRLPDMRKAVGGLPLQLGVSLDIFNQRLHDRSLLPQVWYMVDAAGRMSADGANRLMDRVRRYQRAG